MSTHTPGSWWDETIALICEDNGHCDHPPEMPLRENARLIAASPRLHDALFGLLVALGKHTPDFTPQQLADICPACDEATAALVAAGRVIA